MFSLILSMTGKLNFQTSKAILLPVEFSRIPSNFILVKRGTTDSKCYRLLPEKENIEDYEIFF